MGQRLHGHGGRPQVDLGRVCAHDQRLVHLHTILRQQAFKPRQRVDIDLHDALIRVEGGVFHQKEHTPAQRQEFPQGDVFALGEIRLGGGDEQNIRQGVGRVAGKIAGEHAEILGFQQSREAGEIGKLGLIVPGERADLQKRPAVDAQDGGCDLGLRLERDGV